VNDHPACRFAAVGPAAEFLLDPQPFHDYYGIGSPLQRLCEVGGAVLRLGSDIDTVTLTHYAEYLADVPDKRRVERRYVRGDVGEITVSSLDDSDGIAEWEQGDYFGQILVDFVSQGHCSRGRVGNCTAELLDAQAFVAFATEWMERELSGNASASEPDLYSP
jgi:aminoglycoside N3'-acetyltransferase